jgi:Ca-activated chloride channel family protein
MGNPLYIALALSLPLVPASGQATVRVDVELVNVVATVTDSEGQYVTGLAPGDFIVEDAGIPQSIAHFSQDNDIPISLGIVLDTSASMLRRIQTALAAVERFVRTLHAEDDVFFTTFSSDVRLIQDLTNDRTRLTRALLEARAFGGTALYDAVVRSLMTVNRGRHDKRAILLLTDGADTASELDLADAIKAIGESEVLLYGLGIDPTRFTDNTEHVSFELPGRIIPGAPNLSRNPANDPPVDMDVLEDFADASGGQAYRVSRTWTGGTEDDIDLVLDEVLAQLRSQYSLGYYTSAPADGRFHRIVVRVRDREDYSVRSRSGYLAAGAIRSEP